MKVFLILPTQLFKDVKHLHKYNMVYLLEEAIYINSKFHKQKLLLHIASMKYYYEYLLSNNINVKYFKLNERNLDYKKIFNTISTYEFTMYNPIDKQMIKLFTKYNIKFIDSPMFLNTYEELLNYKNSKLNNKSSNDKINYSQSDFYKFQRIKLNILVNGNKPLYEKWSFDYQNRSKFENNYNELPIKKYNNEYLNYAKKIINTKFNNSFGNINNSYYPCTHKDAINHLKNFIKIKLNLFGKYQDAISKSVIYGNHSNISSLLNIGLLIPKEVINLIMKYYLKSKNKKEIINSVEAIIRQIIGWREYMHFIYCFHSSEITKINYLNLNNKLDKSWYSGNTNLEIVDKLINKLKDYAYLHHIERLMIINNLMFLLEIKFIDIYNWFMTCFIDSYDWVMIPNIMMNINSLDNNIRYMTRVYISSDNYIKKMSDFNNRNDYKIINNLYWNFIKKYKNTLKKDYSLASQISMLKKV
jgi:deoxyribodipyrimidine photolyase-related protein